MADSLGTLQSSSSYKQLYKTKTWKHMRQKVLLRDNFTCQVENCGRSLRKGRTEGAAAVVHHKIAHKGDPILFFDENNLISTCKQCHDGPLAKAEGRGYSSDIGLDGWPTDQQHPLYSKGLTRRK